MNPDPTPDLPPIDLRALERRLRETVRGAVRFDAGTRALYATDASNHRQVPIAVVVPRDTDDVVAAVRACHEHGAPLLPRGAGTSLCGQACNVAVVLDFSQHMNRVLAIDPEARTARVQPGCVLDVLRDAAGRHGLTFAPDPATHSHNTLGGMIGNNSCGPHSVMGGETVHNVLGLEVLTPDGLRLHLGGGDDEARLLQAGGRAAEIAQRLRALVDRHAAQIRAKFPAIPRRVSGYNLPALLPENGFDLARALVGSEGTCVIVLEATLRLLPQPPERTLVVLGYDSVYEAGDHVPEVMQAGPIALEGIDDRLIADMKRTHLHTDQLHLLPPGKGWLLVEFGGQTREQADARAQALLDRLAGLAHPPSMKRVDDPALEKQLWKVRESGLGATAHVPDAPLTWEGWEDSSVPPEQLGHYLRALRRLLERYGYACDLYGHFGQGCVHTRIDFDLETRAGIEKYRAFIHDAARLVVSLGGSISGEHGDGQSKAELLPLMFGPVLVRAFEAFKAIWDPQSRMNPGKVVRPYRADQHLRLGADYAPAPVQTRLFFADDGGDFGRAVLRCVGVGECRKRDGVMCPSYQATGEERHSTRGRAHLLFEMLNGERRQGLLRDGWQDGAVKEALDLCLSCKACKHECPVKVDMAACKAEFLSHHYEHHGRPLRAHLFGFIDRWSAWGAHAPALVNALGRHPLSSALFKRVVGIAPGRRLPALAPSAQRRAFLHGPVAPPGGTVRGEVLLWPDTFNTHFHPQVGIAAREVLQHAGFAVHLPGSRVCCGRPLYEFGFLDQARAYLQRTLAVLAPPLRAGTPIVVLEPACLSVFKDELPMMLPRDENARRLREHAVLFSDFLHRHAPHLDLQPLLQPALLHLHCHHQSVLGTDAERAWLRALELDVHEPEGGCCGMAGSFGFGASTCEVSLRCAERALLPAVRTAPAGRLVIASGYSCREQIAQGTDHPVHHLAEVLRMALPGRRFDGSA